MALVELVEERFAVPFETVVPSVDMTVMGVAPTDDE